MKKKKIKERLSSPNHIFASDEADSNVNSIMAIELELINDFFIVKSKKTIDNKSRKNLPSV